MSENQAGMNAARRYALWHLGDPGWADSILYAYNNPDSTQAKLDKERDSFGND